MKAALTEQPVVSTSLENSTERHKAVTPSPEPKEGVKLLPPHNYLLP